MADPRVRELQAALARLDGGRAVVITPWDPEAIAERFAMHGEVFLARPVSFAETFNIPAKAMAAARQRRLQQDGLSPMRSAYRHRMVARRRRG